MFHPSGLTLGGVVEPVAGEPLGERLAGCVLARFSGALCKAWEHVDVLGIALRFRSAPTPFATEPLPDDQDLLFATIRSPRTMGVAPLGTQVHDFLANRYWAVAPFAVQGAASAAAGPHAR